MAESTFSVKMSQNKPKTQESIQKRLEEWRKQKQQQTGQLKPKANLLKTPNKQITAASHKKNADTLKRAVSSRPSTIHKTKENSGPGTKRKPVSTLNRTAEKTADERRVKSISNKRTHVEELKINPTDESKFDENPPCNFEIEIAPDTKKSRRSTFTIDSPKPEMKDQGTVNTEPGLREQLEAWRAEKRKREAQPKGNPRLYKAPHAQNKPKEPFNLRSDEKQKSQTSRPPKTSINIPSNSRHTMTKPASNGKFTSSKTLQRNIKKFPKKAEICKPNCANKTPKKLVHTPNPSKQRNLPKTPSNKTPLYMDQSLPVRERLELWRMEKRRTMPGKFHQTPSTLKKVTKLKQDKEYITTDVSKQVNQQCPDHEIKERETTFIQKESNTKEENTSKEVNTEKGSNEQEVQKKLQDCMIKVKEEVSDENSLDEISCQLDKIQKEHPTGVQYAEFWICRAKIAEHSGDHGRVMCLYEQASAFSAEPSSLIKEEFSAYSMRRKVEESEETCAQTMISPEDTFEKSTEVPRSAAMTPHIVHYPNEITSPSSIIRYSVTKGTPYRSRLKTCERPTVTPVRRSVRLQRRSVNYPIMLQEHGLTVKHLDELPHEIKEEISFRPNYAVQSELNDAWREIMEC